MATIVALVLCQFFAAFNSAPTTSTDTMEEYMDKVLMVDPAEVHNPLINHHTFTYLLDTEHCSDSVFSLVLVKTAPQHFLERKEIRNTWGSVKNHKGRNILSRFIVGKDRYATNDLNEELLKESAQYGDIIQGDFVDSVKNQTYKSIMGLSWLKQNCKYAQYTLFTNDKTLVDPFHLIEFLLAREQNQTQEFLYCSTFYDHGPSRNPADKFFVTKNDYPYDKFPPHCEGFAYIISSETASKLLDATKLVSYLWLDDVYVTGFLPLKENITHTDMVNTHSYNLMQQEHIDHDMDTSMFLFAKHNALRTNWGEAWSRIIVNHKKR